SGSLVEARGSRRWSRKPRGSGFKLQAPDGNPWSLVLEAWSLGFDMRFLITAALVASTAVAAQAQTHVHGPASGIPHGIPAFCAQPDVTTVASGAWSSGATWSTGRMPAAGDAVRIAAGHTVTYDVVSDA